MENRDKQAGWFVIILSSILSCLSIATLISAFIWGWWHKPDAGLVLELAIPIFLISSFMFFLGFKIRRGAHWAKITALTLLIFIAFLFLLSGFFIGTILMVLGIILVYLSLKSN